MTYPLARRPNVVGPQKLLSLVHKKSCYPKDDVRRVFRAFVEVLADIMADRKEVTVFRLGRFRLCSIRPGKHKLNGKLYDHKPLIYIGFKVSPVLRQEIFRRMDNYDGLPRSMYAEDLVEDEYEEDEDGYEEDEDERDV